jgi:hypothetical protein
MYVCDEMLSEGSKGYSSSGGGYDPTQEWFHIGLEIPEGEDHLGMPWERNTNNPFSATTNGVSNPGVPGRWPDASATTRQPREPQAHSPLGRILHRHQGVEARTYKLRNKGGEIYDNTWDIEQAMSFYP